MTKCGAGNNTLKDSAQFVSFFFNAANRRQHQFSNFSMGARVARFTRSLGQMPTPLHRLDHFAKSCGVGTVFVKDESAFMGLKSFKARGSLWAVANILAKKYGLHPEAPHFRDNLRKACATPDTFVTATDGNHGAGLARTTRLFGQKAEIFMPAGAAPVRVAAIQGLGASCKVMPFNYDETVAYAANYAQKKGAILAQDTAWQGYEEIPALIMEGYSGLAWEIFQDLRGMFPTHVFLQVGVGSLAAAIILAFLTHAVKNSFPVPTFICMEPVQAACLHESLAHGTQCTVTGSLDTVMAGLACGKVSQIAWPILRDNVAVSCACADDLAIKGVNILANPQSGDPPITSGESGAIGAGLLWYLHQSGQSGLLNLDRSSSVLLLSTEGNTGKP